MPKTKHSSIIIFLFVLFLIGGAFFGWLYFKNKSPNTQPSEKMAEISVQELVQNIIDDQNPLIIDLRPGTAFAAGHIPDSASLPYFELNLNSNKLLSLADLPTVLVCENDDCDYLEKAWDTFQELNYKDVKVLTGGFAAYKNEGLAVTSDDELIQKDLAALLKRIKVPDITVSDFNELKKSKDIQLIDTRTSFEFIAGFIPGAINIPLHGLDAAIIAKIIDNARPIYVYDRVGNRALIAAQALIQKGFTNVYNIRGGIEAWKKADLKLDIPKGDGSDFKELMPLLSEPANK